MTRFSFVLLIVTTCVVGVGSPNPYNVGFAQNQAANGGTLRGTITDTTEAQNPIEGVTVKIIAQDSKEWTATTDANGEYKRANLPVGRYIISLYKRGYNQIAKPVTIVDDGDHIIHLKMLKKDNTEKRFSEGLIQHVAENIGERYNLKEPVVEALRQSIHEALNTALEQMNQDVREFATTGQEGSIGLLTGLLSHPDCRAAFARHLTETQLQDYLNFTKARRQRDRKAASQFLTAFLDQALNLTAHQREKVTQSMLDSKDYQQRITSINVFGGESLQHGIVNLLHDELNIDLDEVLNQNQLEIWQAIVNEEKTKWSDKIGAEVLKPRKPVAHGMENGEVDVEPDDPEKQSQDESEGDITETQLWKLAEAILAVHTEQLGTLDERASQRLALVTKGVFQQYFETQDNEPDDDFEVMIAISELLEARKVGKMTREKALEKLNTMREKLWDQRDANIRSGKARLYDIINHPLYQQTIRDVLSEEVFAQYLARQAEREALYQQAYRDLVVTLLDLQLLLDDIQRKQLETTALQVTIGPLSESGFIIAFVELILRTDREIFSPWQRAELEK